MANPATNIVQLTKVYTGPNRVEYQPGEFLRLPFDVAAELVSKNEATKVNTTCVRFLTHGTDNIKRSYSPGDLANIPQEYANRLMAEKNPTVQQVTEGELIAWEAEQAKLAEKAASKASEKDASKK